MKQLLRTHPYVVSGFFLATAVALFFLVRIVWSAVYWSSHHYETVKPWMTIGYIARSWDLNPHELNALAHLPGQGQYGHSPPLSEIAGDSGTPVAEVIKQVETAIATLKQGNATP